MSSVRARIPLRWNIIPVGTCGNLRKCRYRYYYGCVGDPWYLPIADTMLSINDVEEMGKEFCETVCHSQWEYPCLQRLSSCVRSHMYMRLYLFLNGNIPNISKPYRRYEREYWWDYVAASIETTSSFHTIGLDMSTQSHKNINVSHRETRSVSWL